MDLINLSGLPDWQVRGWLPRGFEPERVVFLPDACPGRSPMPTGTAALVRQPNWRCYAVSDCGCGMRLLRSDLPMSALGRGRWESIATRLRKNKGGLGDLGGGNHFLDALEPYQDDRLHFLVHTGSRLESGLVDDLVDDPGAFDRQFERVVHWARDNRAAVQAAVEAEFGPLELVLDRPHNTYEVLSDGAVLIRKGAVNLRPGELSVIPSHMSGDVALVRATAAIVDALCSLSHGTGRTRPRSEAKNLAEAFDFGHLREQVLIPDCVDNASLTTEGPYAYRNLDDCLRLLSEQCAETARFAVVAYMGHL